MGKLIVNEAEFEFEGSTISAGSLKEKWGAPSDDWVWVRLPNGELKQLGDESTIPINAKLVSIVPQNEYGGR